VGSQYWPGSQFGGGGSAELTTGIANAMVAAVIAEALANRPIRVLIWDLLVNQWVGTEKRQVCFCHIPARSKPRATLHSVAPLTDSARRVPNGTLAVMNQTVMFLPLLVALGAFMFFGSRRQKRAMQATIDLHESLRVGDRVCTTSGMYATITRITDDDMDLEIAPGVVTTWLKLAIRERIEPEILDTGAGDVDEIADDPERLPRD
jgi:preprotein translocase subunit YajC